MYLDEKQVTPLILLDTSPVIYLYLSVHFPLCPFPSSHLNRHSLLQREALFYKNNFIRKLREKFLHRNFPQMKASIKKIILSMYLVSGRGRAGEGVHQNKVTEISRILLALIKKCSLASCAAVKMHTEKDSRNFNVCFIAVGLRDLNCHDSNSLHKLAAMTLIICTNLLSSIFEVTSRVLLIISEGRSTFKWRE